MKLIRYGKPGAEKPGLMLADGTLLDVSGFGQDYDQSFFEDQGIEKLRSWYNENKDSCATIEPGSRLGPPLKNPSKIVCVGLNYAMHAKESGMEVPKEPVLFFKATSSITGPYDDIVIPKNSEKTDWEVELAVVIGKKATYVEASEAMDYVAGYMLHNDVSERAFQLEMGGQWVKGKSADTFAPIGPELVTSDEVDDPHNLALWLKLNDETVQNSNTSDLIFSIPELISYISRFMSLLPGDVISTGTPSGVGLGLEPPRFLKSGDVVELGIDHVGTSKQNVKAFGE
ncbi:fumarylacetoacetate hydrolase family protein [Fulvivirgaceae bacterium BMA12]|uniref:Fumarylacetoacetate hydrolase family protein n=1 Tax=Agaribacillus aureus TaxID=3051825 RepID=A0ABT8LIL6_9BACT|nr:fumarylacetoacetate hydrolase family protein [Fulvivirgaceae bacterium BMA12]